MERKGWIFTLGAGVVALSALDAYWTIDDRSESGAEARLASLEAEIKRPEAKSIAAENEARRWMIRNVDPAAPLPDHRRGGVTTAQEETAEHTGDGEKDSLPSPPVLEDRLKEAFAVERPDPAWDRPASDRARDTIASALPPESSIRDVSCRGALCRVEIAHTAKDAHEKLVRAILQSPGFWDGPTSISAATEGTGEIVTLAFLGRPGSGLAPGSVWE